MSILSAIRRGLTQPAQIRLLRNSVLRSPEHVRVGLFTSPTCRDKKVLSVIQSRCYSTPESASRNEEPKFWLLRGSNVRVSTLFTALLALGAGATVLGLYEIYTSFTQWPVELRKDLRAGIRAKNQGDYALSERFLTRAYQTALDLPLSVLGSDPYLKLSGIAAVLAEVAPERRAKEVLRKVWEKGDVSSFASSLVGGPTEGHASTSTDENENDWAGYTLTNEERLRRVAVACKLAELSSQSGADDAVGEEEEKWLVWSVEEVLRLAGAQGTQTTRSDHVADSTAGGGGVTPRDGTSTSTTSGVVLAELELPSWMRKVDLGAPLAALGSVYARKGNVEYAMPLYLQAISLLLPPNAKNVSIEDRCEAAQWMNNLSELIMRRPPSPEIRHQAEAWARQAHGIIQRVEETSLARKGWFTSGSDQGKEVCDQVFGVVLFNLGMLREMDKDLTTARALYEQSLKQCEKVGMKEGVMEIKQALRRIGRASGKDSV